MKIFCQRRERKRGRATMGDLVIDGTWACYTLEDVVREVLGEPVEKWKVLGETAIPSTAYVGKPYKVTMENSPRFGPNTITLNNVPGYIGVRAHGGNRHEHTEGCPLLGLSIVENENGCEILGGTSGPAVEKVKRLILAALDRGEEVWWWIANPGLPMGPINDPENPVPTGGAA